MKSNHARSLFVVVSITLVLLFVCWKAHAGGASVTLFSGANRSSVDVNSSNLVFSMTVTNTGTLAASNIQVIDMLPLSVDILSISNAAGSITQALNVVTWTIPNLSAGTAVGASILVSPTVAGLLTNDATISLNGGPESLPAELVIQVGADLSASANIDNSTCTNTTKGAICTITGTLSLLNFGNSYLDADFTLSQNCKLPPKVGCKITGTLNVTSINLPHGMSHVVAFYLSDDTILDVNDALIAAITSDAIAKAVAHAKPPVVKFKLPKGVLPSGKYIIVVVDAANTVSESDENNNTSVMGPLP